MAVLSGGTFYIRVFVVCLDSSMFRLFCFTGILLQASMKQKPDGKESYHGNYRIN